MERLDVHKDLEGNIDDLLLEPYSPVREVIEQTFLTGVSWEIIARIGNSGMKFREIEVSLSFDARGMLDREIKRLLSMEIVTKSFPLNHSDDRRKSFHELSDNLLRFYSTYVFPWKSNLQMLAAPAFFDAFIKDSLGTFISKRFEAIARSYLKRQVQAGNLPGVIDIGTYWYDDKERRENGEFDCVLKTKEGSYVVYEVKYLKDPMSETAVTEAAMKIQQIPGFRPVRIGFISGSGFEKRDPHYAEIDGEMRYRR
ncbi:MAG: DUF234 domain-containing protein [Sphaerochaetaceae bacterium]